jgi:precorrin-2 dehydrogenase/sirohydrochlorin ferrochelatase
VNSVEIITTLSDPVTRSAYYPVFLTLKGKRAVVVGGGKVAERKIMSLMKVGACIKVISPYLTKRLEKERKKGTITHLSRYYKKGDLKNAFLVIAATSSPDINRRVSEDASCLVNVVDTPDLCNFIVPSVIKRGALTFAISTSGISPGLSRSIRKEIETLYGTEFSDYLKSLKIIRINAMKIIRDKKRRGIFLKEIASDRIIKMLRVRGPKETKRFINDLFKKAVRP